MILESIKQIKNYLFYDNHNLADNEYKQFDPSFYIAQSWNRLSSKNKNDIDSHDLLLIKHEIYEKLYYKLVNIIKMKLILLQAKNMIMLKKVLFTINTYVSLKNIKR